MTLALDWLGGGIFGGGIAACIVVALAVGHLRRDTISARQARKNARDFER